MKKSLFSRLAAFFRQRLDEPVVQSVPPPDAQAPAVNPLSEPAPEQDVIKHYELAPSARRIIVRCGSCGARHELDAVCARCGLPLCKDERNCRYQVNDSVSGMRIIVCQNCK